MGNPFVHAELNTTDVDKAKTFYGKLFDWKFEPMPGTDGQTYTTIAVGQGTGGGIFDQKIPGFSSGWIPYVMVGDVPAATKKAKALGATILKDATPIPEMGQYSILRDPTGAIIGLFQTSM